MTNLAAFKIYEGKDVPMKNAVLVADSQTTARDLSVKTDNAQKMFELNGSLLMSSGYRQPALDIYEELKKASARDPGQIAQQILDISTRLKLPPRMPLDFIVAGNQEGQARLFFVNATGFTGDSEKSTSDNKGMSEQFYAFSGSGSNFATRVVSGNIDVGIDPRPRNITSGISLMRAVAQAATESIGVNDRLQYGVITPDGPKMLFHPNVSFEDDGEAINYFRQLFGSAPTPFADRDSLASIAGREANRHLFVVNRDFYDSFDTTFSDLNREMRDYRFACDLHLRDGATLNDIKVQAEKYRSMRVHADAAVDALLGKNSILDFIRTESGRREAFYAKLATKSS